MKNLSLLFLLFLGCFSQSLFAQVDLQKGLLVHLKMDGNVADSSGNNHHATLVSASLTKDRQNQSNMAYYFDGSADYITIPNFANKIPKDSITISLWLKPTQLKGGNTFMVMPDDPSNRFAGSFYFSHNSKGAHFCDYGNISKRVFYDSEKLDTNWVFIVMTRDKNSMSLYKNSGLLQSVNSPNNFSPKTGELRIGGGQDGNYNGAMDDFRIYNRVLNSKEIDALYTTAGAGVQQNRIVGMPGIYPNPSNGSFTIDLLEGSVTQIHIFNDLGQHVSFKQTNEIITLDNPVSGVYYIRAIIGNEIKTQKMIVVNDASFMNGQH